MVNISGGPVTVTPQSCTGPSATDRATDSSMRAVNSMKDFCHSADHAFLMRAKLSDTENSGSETYRKMVAPSLSAEHFHYEQGINFHHVHVSMCKILQEGMMVTREDYVRSTDNDGMTPDLQPHPQPAETTPSQPPIPEATPTQPHPPPETTPPLPPPYLMKIVAASAEETLPQKPDPPGIILCIQSAQPLQNASTIMLFVIPGLTGGYQ